MKHQPEFFYYIWVVFHEHSRITGLQGKGEGISLTPHYHFHPLYRHLDISRAITADSSPLHLVSTRTRTGYRREQHNLMLLTWNASGSIVKQNGCKNKTT